MRVGSSFAAVAQDLRYGTRVMGANPGFAAVAIVTLALGIGANTTIFSAMNALVLRPLRLHEPDRIVMISERALNKMGMRDPTMASSSEWQKHARLFENIERGDFFGSPANMTGAGRAERVSVAYCTPGYLAMLGAKAYRGRTLLAEDAVPGTAAAVISADFWNRSFAGDPDILGQTVVIEGKPIAIAGVLPPGFSITPWEMRVDFWIPTAHMTTPEARWMPVVGRLKRGVSVEQGEAELNGLARGQGADPKWRVEVKVLHERLLGGSRQFFWILFCAVGFVLLIACVNVANLLLARAAVREKEIAIRVSLGAGRWRLMRQLLAESTLLALAGGAVGALVGVMGIRVLLRLIPLDEAPALPIDVDFRVLGFTLALSLVTGVLFGLMPAVRASRPDLHSSLKEGGRQSSGGSSQRSQGVLLVLETALAMVLLVGAGLLISSFMRLQKVELGFNPRHVLSAQVKLAGPKYVQPGQGLMKSVTPQGDVYFQELIERVRAIPGVRLAGTGSRDLQPRSFRVIGRPAPGPEQGQFGRFNEVGGDYFQALEIPLRKGRYVSDRDAEGSPWVVNINETLAKRYFPNEEPLGKMLLVRILGGPTGINPEEDRPREIVGVVADVRHYGAGSDPFPVMYSSYRQHVTAYPGGYYIGHVWKHILVRTAGDPMGISGALQKAAADVDKDQPLFAIETMERSMTDSVAGQRFLMRLFGIFAAIALALAAVGIYGVMSYLVTQRTHEIGLRVALGASRADVLRIVVGRGLAITGIGLAAGIGVSLLLTKVIKGLLFGVKTTDPLTYTAVSLVLMLVAAAACWVPARRALDVDPMAALRHE